MKLHALLLLATALTAAAAPAVTNVTASQRAGTKLVDAYYTVAGTPPFTVRMEVSTDNGVTFTIPAVSVSGDQGPGIIAGSGKHIVWDAGNDWDGNYTAQCRVKILATDASAQAVPPGMAWIPAGAANGGSTVSAFYMDRFEVSLGLWQSVLTWAVSHGYNIGGGSGAASNHPVVNVSWYDCIKWCNARSEKEGLTPAYYTEAAQTNVYRSGNVDVQNTWVKWSANGYRLPTDAEWHRAASGNAATTYPWGNTMTGADGNYSSSGDPFGSFSIQTTPVGYYNGTTYALTGGGTFVTNDRKNSFGLYDVCGNAWEWTWDWYGGSYPDATSNFHGPTSGQYRVLRGGSWSYDASDSTLAVRYYVNPTVVAPLPRRVSLCEGAITLLFYPLTLCMSERAEKQNRGSGAQPLTEIFSQKSDG